MSDLRGFHDVPARIEFYFTHFELAKVRCRRWKGWNTLHTWAPLIKRVRFLNLGRFWGTNANAWLLGGFWAISDCWSNAPHVAIKEFYLSLASATLYLVHRQPEHFQSQNSANTALLHTYYNSTTRTRDKWGNHRFVWKCFHYKH